MRICSVYTFWACRVYFAVFFGVILGLGQVQAQEIGIHIGRTLYKGDLHPEGLEIQHHRLAGGLFYRHVLSDVLSLRANLLVGGLKGSDAAPPDELGRQRQQHFQTTIAEVAMLLEYQILGPPPSYARFRASPYAFAGLGGMLFSGQEDPTVEVSRFQPVLPFGLGLRLPTGRSSALGLRLSLHKTFFDYLDNTSALRFQEKNYKYGDRYSKDWYYYVAASFSFKIFALRCPSPVKAPERTY